MNLANKSKAFVVILGCFLAVATAAIYATEAENIPAAKLSISAAKLAVLGEKPEMFVEGEFQVGSAARVLAKVRLDLEANTGFVEHDPSFLVQVADAQTGKNQEFHLEPIQMLEHHLKRLAASGLAERTGVRCPRIQTVQLVLNGRPWGLYSLIAPLHSELPKLGSVELKDSYLPLLAWEAFTLHNNGLLYTGSNAVILPSQEAAATELGAFFAFPSFPVLWKFNGELEKGFAQNGLNRRKLLEAISLIATNGQVEADLTAFVQGQVLAIGKELTGKKEQERFFRQQKFLTNMVSQRFHEVRKQLDGFSQLSDKELELKELARLSLDDPNQPQSLARAQTKSAGSEFRRMVSDGSNEARFPARVFRVEILESVSGELSALSPWSPHYSDVTIRSNGQEFEGVGLRLKGYSTRQTFKGKPSFTLKFNKNTKGQTSFGNSKWHFHNAMYNPSYLNEFLGAWLFKRAGMPCPEVAFASVKVNGVDYGVFSLVEGSTRQFLARHFTNATEGLLFEGEFGDIASNLDPDTHPVPANYSALSELAKAAEIAIREKNFDALQPHISSEALARFIALENVLGHEDGYTLSTHNYRLFHEHSQQGHFHLLPHGLDNIHLELKSGAIPNARGLLAKALFASRQGEDLYVQVLEKIVKEDLDLNQLAIDLAAATRQIQSLQKECDPILAPRQLFCADLMVSRIAKRKEYLLNEINLLKQKRSQFQTNLNVTNEG